MSMTDKTSSRLTHTLSPSQGQREIGLPGTSDRCLSPPSLPEGEGATRSCRRHEPLPSGAPGRVHDIRCASALDPRDMAAIRRKALLEGCKWDAQVGDITTLAPFPLVMSGRVWGRLASWAEQLTAEAVAAEKEIVERPDLLHLLGLPRALENILADKAPLTPSAGRVIRYDFHFSSDGWRISEANSDAPGGYSESSHFSSMMAEHFPHLGMAGNPARIWSDTLSAAAGPGGVVALLSAPGYMEDQQLVSFLAARLGERGCRAHLAKPEQLHWDDGRARLDTRWYRGVVDAIYRFYQADWISKLRSPSRCTDWRLLFRRGLTPVANPALAVITESKRFALVWDDLKTEMPTWRALLPETRDPRDAPWVRDDNWLVKTAMCNTGDTVSIRELMTPNQWLQTRLKAGLSPSKWVAQRRFESVPVPTPAGPRHVCVGIYTVNGRPAGVYARLAEKPLIDYAAVDVALLIDDDD